MELLLNGSLWDDFKGTDRTMPESGGTSSNAWVSNNNQWSKSFLEANDNIGPGEFFIKEEVPDSFAGLAVEKSLSALDVSTAEVLLEDILSPALSIKEWDGLTPENALHNLMLDDVLASFHCDGEEMNAVDEIGVNLRLEESQLMLSSDMDIFVDDSIYCQESEKDATKSCSLPLSIGTSMEEFELVETSNIIKKEGYICKFSWETIDSLENADNIIPKVKSSTSEAKELPSLSSTSTEESSLDNHIPSSSLALEKLGVQQTSVHSQEGNNNVLFYKGICQQLSIGLDGEDQDLSEMLTELEQQDIIVLRDNESDPKRGMNTHNLKELKTSIRIQDSEGAERTTTEIAEESEVSSQSCSTADSAYERLKVHSDRKRTANKFRRHFPFSKDSYRSSHRNSHTADSERKSSVPLLCPIVAVHSPPLQSSEASSVPCALSGSFTFPNSQAMLVFNDTISALNDTIPDPCVSSVPLVTSSFSSITSSKQPQSIRFGHRHIVAASQQQHLMNSGSFGLPLSANAIISAQPIVQELLIYDRQTHSKSAPEKLQEELATQTLLAGHIQICNDHRQEVHTQFQHQEKGHALSGCGELITSLTPPLASVLPVGSNMLADVPYDKKELSREATILHQLQATVLQLDVETSLLIRDALYRLAKNATERKAMDEDKSCSSTALDLENAVYGTNSLLGCELQSQRYVEVQTGETKTNAMDRAIADLLFHRRGNSQVESAMVMDPSLSCNNMPSVESSLNLTKLPPSMFHCSTGILHSQDMVSTVNISQAHHPCRSVALGTEFISVNTQLPGFHHFDQDLNDSTLRRLPNSSVASVSGIVGSLPLVKSMCADIPPKPLSVFPMQNVGRESVMLLPLAPPVFQATTPSVNLPKIDSHNSHYGEMFQIGMSNAHPFFGHSNQVKKFIPRMRTAAAQNPFLRPGPNRGSILQHSNVEFTAVLPHG